MVISHRKVEKNPRSCINSHFESESTKHCSLLIGNDNDDFGEKCRYTK